MTENESLQERETHRVHFWRSAFPPTGYVGSTEVPADFDGNAALTHAFIAFNRGSGMETKFDGPSASVGDVFAIEKQSSGGERTLEAYRIERTGFQAVEFPPIADAIREQEASQPDTVEKVARRQRDLDTHDRMVARAATEAARDTLHDSGPGRLPGEYTTHEARDRAHHTPAFTRE